ncbi:ATP-binding protein [Pseudomonas sp. MAHUQ-62]|uniref:ATP-binding protein n=1 Tax=Pseudomonas sp. GCM10023245 TaxID=3252652 RepID=UPI003611F9D2
MSISRVSATYLASPIPEYQGNPLIEALPPIRSMEDVALSLGNYPVLPQEERNMEGHLRLHCMQRLYDLTVGLPLHIDLAQAISELIRRGYVGRNPICALTTRHLNAVSTGMEDASPLRSTASTITIVGLSGMGKTTALKMLLSEYPQVIFHRQYHERSFFNAQIVYLHMDCPFDGTLKGLCLSFFDAVDEALGEPHYGEMYSKRSSIDYMVRGMKLVASTFYVGALFIDELQNLNRAKAGGAEKMLSFFVTLVNTVGIPIVVIGNNSMLSLFSKEMRIARRFSGNCFRFDRFEREDPVWRELLLDKVWEYQWLPSPSGLTEDICNVLYDLTQGVVDFLIKLLVLGQRYAIQNGMNSLSEDVLRHVASNRMKILEPALDALRSNDPRKMLCFEDLLPTDEQINTMMAWIPSGRDWLNVVRNFEAPEPRAAQDSSSASFSTREHAANRGSDTPLEDFKARGLVVNDLEEFD